MPGLAPIHTVLFSDVVGSSKLYQALGNQKAEEKIHFVVQTLSACALKYSGTVIKTIGDEIMCSFTSLNDATECAIEMNVLVQESSIELRTGISSGALIERNGDIFGDVVNNAAFLTKTARAREILVDEMALDNGGVSSSKRFELIAEMTIKGRSSACKIYRVNWEHATSSSLGATQVNNVLGSNANFAKSLMLEYHGQQYTVDKSNPIFVIGRDKSGVALKINHVKISRKHCTIELKQGKFILQDHSTNGTYVERDDAEHTQVHREAFALLGSGKIKLGQSDSSIATSLSFRVL